MSRLVNWFAVILAQLVLLYLQAEAAGEIEDQETNDLLNWEAPYTLRKNFPYFLTGYDDVGCPIWVCEYGKWDVRNQLESKLSTPQEVRKYILQFLTTMYESPKRLVKKAEKNSDNETVEYCPDGEFTIIGDMDGYSNRQLTSIPAVTATLTMAADFFAMNTRGGFRMKKAVGLNLNFVANTIYELVKPFVGQLTERALIFGTNEEKWRPQLLRLFPRESLPEYLGGFSNHTPVQIYG